MSRQRIHKADLELAITAHLKLYGDAQWERFGEHKVPFSTFRRWVNHCKAELKQIPAKPKPAGRKPIMIVPGPPLTMTMAEPLNLMREIRSMLATCDLLQEHATKTDPVSGVVSVKNPRGLAAACNLRATVLRLAGETNDRLWGTERVASIHRTMLQRIAKLAPETARLIIQDLRKMDEEWGTVLE